MLIYDLKRQVTFTPGKANFHFLETEFKRINLSISWKWNEKINGYPYLLAFHKREAEFLLAEVSKLDQYNTELKGLNPSSDFLTEIYTSIALGLSELIDRIVIMEHSTAIMDQSALKYN
ncbi:hypothetical protein ASU31_10450 [Pedobacter ginsenosidimutans]|uniref:Uncharacterized protein n=2 Tax=Pedobacter ginsenosidimutans TaxID=687842 RepID=A0A0T5VPX0_9SPHI|nr:hypothetical protein ASU31_10450 [Pedobacter ginsenosidimutans]